MKITLCGSTRFKKEFEDANERLTEAGHVVYSVAFFGQNSSGENWYAKPLEDWTKQRLDLVHLAKILNSDAVLVVGSDDDVPYIGESTRREVFWAGMNNKRIYYAVHGDVERLVELI